MTDSQTFLDLIATRRSVKATLLKEPAPTDEELNTLLQIAMSAPDHGAIRPWRFKVIRGEARGRMGDLFAQALQAKDPYTCEEELETIRGTPLRFPLIIAVGVDIVENHPKVPPTEQVIATACATQNLLLAAHAAGWGAVLLTGWVAYDPLVRRGLGFRDKDEMVGFVYLGTPSETPRSVTRPDVRRFTEVWTG